MGCIMVIDRELERQVYNLYNYIEKYLNKHSVDAEDVYIELFKLLSYIILIIQRNTI